MKHVFKHGPIDVLHQLIQDPWGSTAVEFALEALYLARQVAKDSDDDTAVYGP